MSLYPGKRGETWVLDQVNGRAQKFAADGRLRGELRLDGDTAQDLIVGGNGEVYVLDRLGKGEISVYDEDGKLLGRDAIVGGPIHEGGAVTGMFSDPSGLWLEREHTDLVRISTADGSADPLRPTVPGRPSRDGTSYVRAALVGRGAPSVDVLAWDRDATAQPRWQRTLALPRPVWTILLLDTDLRGHVYLAARIADEGGPPSYGLVNEATVVVRLMLATGADAGLLTLPPYNGAEEMFRELAVSDDGEVLQMIPSQAGVTVTAYSFP